MLPNLNFEIEYIKNNIWLSTNLSIKEYESCNDSVKRVETPSDECIKEFAKYNHLDYSIAKKYFNKNCYCCGKRIEHKYEIGMSIKYNGEDTECFLCKNCFLTEYDYTDKEYVERIQVFKDRDCDLI